MTPTWVNVNFRLQLYMQQFSWAQKYPTNALISVTCEDVHVLMAVNDCSDSMRNAVGNMKWIRVSCFAPSCLLWLWSSKQGAHILSVMIPVSKIRHHTGCLLWLWSAQQGRQLFLSRSVYNMVEWERLRQRWTRTDFLISHVSWPQIVSFKVYSTLNYPGSILFTS